MLYILGPTFRKQDSENHNEPATDVEPFAKHFVKPFVLLASRLAHLHDFATRMLANAFAKTKNEFQESTTPTSSK